MQRIKIKDCCLLAMLLGVLFLTFLGNRPLFVPDEGRYAEIAREMMVSGNYAIPHLNGIVYFEKPPLFYWLGASAFRIAGVHIGSIRLINALFGLLGCLLTYAVATTLYDRKTGLIAACILGTSLLYFVMAHMVSLDLPVTFFIMATLYASLIGIETKSNSKRRLFIYLAAIAGALAVLTKGLIGILFPLMIVGLWILLNTKRRRPITVIKNLYLPTALLLFLLIAMPWHVISQLHYPQFFSFYFIEQHFLRYTDRTIGHDEPIWFFIPYLMIGFLPWIIYLPQTIKLHIRALYQKNATAENPSFSLFFLVWLIFIFLFFSFSKSKLIPYILPLFPALAILEARLLVRFNIKKIFIAFCCTAILLLALLAYAPKLDTRTILPLATILKSALQPQDEVITYNQYYQDLPFYLERCVSILNWKNELSFGMQLEDTSSWMINDQAFEKRWDSAQQVYVIMGLGELEAFKKHHTNQSIRILGTTRANALITNH